MLDAGHLSLARRERLFWFDWEIPTQPGCFIINPQSTHSSQFGRIQLEANLQPSKFLEPGWHLASPGRVLPTFTAAQSCSQPRSTSPGLDLCTESDLQRWHEDGHKFAPYHYQWRNGLVSSSESWRLPSIQEREAILGFPATTQCKFGRKACVRVTCLATKISG